VNAQEQPRYVIAHVLFIRLDLRLWLVDDEEQLRSLGELRLRDDLAVDDLRASRTNPHRSYHPSSSETAATQGGIQIHPPHDQAGGAGGIVIRPGEAI
jgi:hypothetical protein